MAELLPHYRGIPKAVRVGCYHFKIEVGEFEDHESERSFGHMNPISQKIRLRPGMSAQNLANTFIHEVLHAIHWFQCCSGMSGEQSSDVEEEYTTKGANGICAFWQDNPKATAWWQKILKLGEQE